MKTEVLIAKISDLPIEQRAKAVDQILKTFNESDPDIEKAWIKEAKRRLKEFESGEAESIPGEQVMGELKNITRE